MMISVPLVPPSPNELRRKYRSPHAYRRLRKLWEQELFYGASCSRHRNELIRAAETKRMAVAVTIYHQKEYDPDNLTACLKPILDALKNIHFLRDDDSAHLELKAPQQFTSANRWTLVTIYPLT